MLAAESCSESPAELQKTNQDLGKTTEAFTLSGARFPTLPVFYLLPADQVHF